MAEYSIFVLGEDLMDISDSGQLDGVDQGDGSHLEGLTITLNSNAWQEVFITDDDTDFRDNDSSQTLLGDQTINGTDYDAGSVVEAEYGIVLTDGVNEWQVVGFNVRDSNPSYATVEGLAFIGGPGGFPPVGVPLRVDRAQEGPNFDVPDYATPICYLRGTLIDTPGGPRPIETLAPGDLIETRDNGPLPLRWVGGRHVIAAGRCAPVRIPAGLMGTRLPLTVSQQHRVLLCDPRAELLFGEAEVFVTASQLAEAGLGRIEAGGVAEYFHVALDSHAVIRANGAWSESYHAGHAQSEAVHFFPELAGTGFGRGPLARRVLRRHEARVLLATPARIDPDAVLRHSA